MPYISPASALPHKSGDTWGDTDISGEDASVQAVCNAVWTGTIKSAYETFADAQASITENNDGIV